jgi:uncharacterized membrane protein YfcA
MIELLGWFSALLIGISLGLIGGGGSILTIPVLVYLIGLDMLSATSYSLFIVGSSSLVGAALALKNKQADLRIALAFGAPSIVSVFITRFWLLPIIPENMLGMDKGAWLMGLFALLMLLASRSMIRGSNAEPTNKPNAFSLKTAGLVVGQGLGVGLLTGLLGAGGGFIIIPVLVQVTGLPMKKAIGTTLVIIAANSLIGFVGDLANVSPNWPFLLLFSGLSILGIFIGIGLSQRIPGAKLKRAFGWFVLIMALLVLLKQGLALF